MTLYIRQLAWLNASPKDDDRKPSKTPPLTRLKQLGENAVIPLPPVQFGMHLVNFLFEIGPFQSGGMGAAPVPFTEIESWQRQCGHDLQPWEVVLLRDLSRAYVHENASAESPDAPQPWMAIEMIDRDVVSDKVRLIFGGRR